jgi:predicted PurR-regulated permease PerM
MLLDRKPYTFDRVFRIGIAVALLWGLIWLLGYLSDVLIPFAVALILAYMINPMVNVIQKKIPHRLAAVFMSLSIVIALAVFLVWLIIPMIITEIKHTGQLLSNLVNNADLAQHAAKRLPPDLWQAIKDYASRQEVQQFFKTENFWKIAEMAARKVLPGVWGLITGTASFIMGLVGLAVIGLYLVFLLLDYEKVFQEWKELLPPSHRETIMGFVSDFESAMNRYFRGQAVVASIVGGLFATGFLLIGLPMGILLGLFIGLLNMVPYLQIIGLIPAILLALVYALETGTSFLVILGLTGLVFIVVQIIQDAILVPKIMGRVTGLNPAMILLSLSIWGKLLGIFGLLIALPLTFLLLAYYRQFIVTRYSEAVQPPPTDT